MHALSKTYKIDDLYNISGNNMKLIFDIIE